MVSVIVEDVLIIGAHPDDFEIMAGGAIVKIASIGMARIHAVTMTDGSLAGDPEIRRKETEAAAKVLGVTDLDFMEIKDGSVQHNHATVEMIEKLIKRASPDIIITHSPDDTHQDHKNIGSAVISAARRHPNLLLGETPSTFPPLQKFISIDITKEFPTKIEALKCHKSQISESGGPVNLDETRSVAGYRGGQIGVKYAEAFEVWKMALWKNE